MHLKLALKDRKIKYNHKKYLPLLYISYIDLWLEHYTNNRTTILSTITPGLFKVRVSSSWQSSDPMHCQQPNTE